MDVSTVSPSILIAIICQPARLSAKMAFVSL
jgi:hypothetical protein